MYNKQLITRITELFNLKLQVKTNWGRTDVMTQYKDAVNEAVLELLDKE